MNPSSALATVLVDALAAGGVRHLVLAPGSRSAPLAYAGWAAADAGRLRVHVRIDERVAGFLALGLAKETGSPVAVAVTSGTAVANLHPAVLESAYADVPLLVLSADRPHRLRGTGANQTADQVRLFGTALRASSDLPAAGGGWSEQPIEWRNEVARLLAAALGRPAGQPGPVQLNVGFDDPLVPDPDDDPDHEDVSPLLTGGGLTRVPATRPAGVPAAELLPPGPRTVVLAGDGAGAPARRLAERFGWPLLAEPSSGARCGPNAIGPYRLLLEHPQLAAAVQRVVAFGHPTLNRSVAALTARPDLELVVVSARSPWPDPGRRASTVVPAVELSDDGGPAGPAPDRPDDWLARWQDAAAKASHQIDLVLDAEAAAGRLTGPLVARELAAVTGPGQALVLASSNPIRDVDLAGAPFPAGDRAVLANRGLSGIDGTLSTAAGVALARAEAGAALPVRVLVGDLGFLHDLGGLLVGPLEEQPQLQVVLLDDGGGGIFGLLEQGRLARRGDAETAVFERLFGTPQQVDVAALCAGLGAAYHRVDGSEPEPLARLRAALLAPPAGRSVLHLPVRRAGQHELGQRLRTVALSVLDQLD